MTTEAQMEAFQAKASALAAKAIEFCYSRNRTPGPQRA